MRAITGKGPRSERNVIKSLRLQPDVLKRIFTVCLKIRPMEKNWYGETYGEPDPEIVFGIRNSGTPCCRNYGYSGRAGYSRYDPPQTFLPFLSMHLPASVTRQGLSFR